MTRLPMLRLTSLLLLTSVGVAQNRIGMNADTSAFASRGSSTANPVELSVGFDSDIVRGLGETSTGAAALTAADFVVQDPNSATAEQFSVTFRTGSRVSGPSSLPSGLIAMVGPISIPLGSGGPAAWQINLGFATPVGIPSDSFFVAGLALPGRTASSNELFAHVSTARGGLGAHALAPIVAWEFQTTSGSVNPLVSGAVGPSVPRLAIHSRRSALAVANIPGTGLPPIFSLGGHFPDTTAAGPATQGIAFAAMHPAGAAAQAFVLASLGFDLTPDPIPGIANRFLLDAATLIPAATAVGDADGRPFTYIPAGIGALPSSRGARAYFQALVIDAGAASFEFTNAVAVTLF
ncbi:MAG: hypothetical protein AB7I19_08440 [Planctomycetota bacterium]